jgi:hypothetical protein
LIIRKTIPNEEQRYREVDEVKGEKENDRKEEGRRTRLSKI